MFETYLIEVPHKFAYVWSNFLFPRCILLWVGGETRPLPSLLSDTSDPFFNLLQRSDITTISTSA